MRGVRPWENLWKAKYASNCQIENLITLTSSITRSAIWSLTHSNMDIIQNHILWEVTDGNKALF